MDNKNRAVGFGSPAEAYAADDTDWRACLFPLPHAMYGFRVIGRDHESLGIMEGDIVIVNTASQPRKGDIAGLLMDDEFHIGRMEGGGLFFDGESRYPLPPEARIAGTVSRLLRFFEAERIIPE